MQKQARAVQIFGFGLVAAVICLGTLRELKSGHNGRNDRPNPRFQYTFRLIRQEAASPGKLIEADLNGTPLPPYKCTDEDAAIAVCTMADSDTGLSQTPNVLRAIDADNHGYIAKVVPDGPAWIIRLQSGFSTVPGSITVTVGPSNAIPSPSPLTPRVGATFQFTKIAMPSRVLAFPSPAKAASAAKVGTVTVDDSADTVSVRSVEAPSSKGYVIPQIIGTSYSAEDPLQFGVTSLADNYTYYGRGIDTLKVRFDRFKYVESDAILTYRNAEVVKAGNVGMVVLRRQDVGTAFGLHATISNQPNPAYRSGGGSPLPSREVIIWLYPASKVKSAGSSGRPISSLALVGMSPSPKSIGLQHLHISVLSESPDVTGFYTAIDSRDSSVAITSRNIPKLSICLRMRTAYPDSSITAVLPVKHVTARKSNLLLPHPAPPFVPNE